MALGLQHQTAAQFADRLRAKWRAAEKLEKGRLATWIIDRHTAGDITTAQIRTAFQLDAAQFTAFAARLQTLRTHYLAIMAEAQE